MDESTSKRPCDPISVKRELRRSKRHEKDVQPSQTKTTQHTKGRPEVMEEPTSKRKRDPISFHKKLRRSERHEKVFQSSEEKISQHTEEQTELMEESTLKRTRDYTSFQRSSKRHKKDVQPSEERRGQHTEIQPELMGESSSTRTHEPINLQRHPRTSNRHKKNVQPSEQKALQSRNSRRGDIDVTSAEKEVTPLDLAETRPVFPNPTGNLSDMVHLNQQLIANTQAINAYNSNIYVNSTINQNYSPKNQVGYNQGPAPDEKKTQFLKELKNGYGKQCGGIQPVSFMRDKYTITDLFVESGIKLLEKSVGESEEREKWVELEKYRIMFTDPKAKSKRRIIDGEPGYGKSTLALQITHDWCHDKAWMKDFEILILIPLRRFKNVPSVYSAIKKFLLPKDSKLTEDDIKSILDSSSTVILLDGYDEYPDRQNEDTDINHIIRGDMFQEHEVILTTRTSCLPPDHENATVKRLRLTGFDKTSREIYIYNAVSRGCSEVADKIHRFLEENTEAEDFIEIPLFFTMICYMVKISERFRNLKTVTQFFRHIIKCFYSNRKVNKETAGIRAEDLDHSKLDEIAFEGLGDEVQQISGEKSILRDKIGKDLYDEYVRIGILIEEEVFDFDTLEYNIETRFFHKLFAEWHAAHYLAKAAAQQEAEFERWPEYMYKSWQEVLRPQTNTSQSFPKTANSFSIGDFWRRLHFWKRVYLVKSLDPHDVHYMYRCACGLNPEAALKIIKHLGSSNSYDKYTTLCLAEWDGNLDTVKDTVNSLCTREIEFHVENSLLLQKSTMKLLNFASDKQIPIDMVSLYLCILVEDTGGLRVMPSNLKLPVVNTLSVLGIHEPGRVFTEEETVGILQYAVMCRGLKELWFYYCQLPRSIKRDDVLSTLQTSNVLVRWWPDPQLELKLRKDSGEWEDFGGNREPMTDEQYQEAKETVQQYIQWSDSEEGDKDGAELI